MLNDEARPFILREKIKLSDLHKDALARIHWRHVDRINSRTERVLERAGLVYGNVHHPASVAVVAFPR